MLVESFVDAELYCMAARVYFLSWRRFAIYSFPLNMKPNHTQSPILCLATILEFPHKTYQAYVH